MQTSFDPQQIRFFEKRWNSPDGVITLYLDYPSAIKAEVKKFLNANSIRTDGEFDHNGLVVCRITPTEKGQNAQISDKVKAQLTVFDSEEQRKAFLGSFRSR